MPPGSRTGLRDGRAAGRVHGDPGRSGAGGRTPARNHPAGLAGPWNVAVRQSGAVSVAGVQEVRLPGASRPVVPSR